MDLKKEFSPLCENKVNPLLSFFEVELELFVSNVSMLVLSLGVYTCQQAPRSQRVRQRCFSAIRTTKDKLVKNVCLLGELKGLNCFRKRGM